MLLSDILIVSGSRYVKPAPRSPPLVVLQAILPQKLPVPLPVLPELVTLAVWGLDGAIAGPVLFLFHVEGQECRPHTGRGASGPAAGHDLGLRALLLPATSLPALQLSLQKAVGHMPRAL
ncbi:hypothetical protein SKAU_G00373100 [Synaphobranchus kaupii]|uniref:Uncharacterized protein n=1 Tax=Synaphobranchus kaupii TaxID=118154 RepID=A0A9Q1EGH7_SYNKA|nr:hypothetical protein SKAU_G00373100 [Synaphobranchus kaupii]